MRDSVQLAFAGGHLISFDYAESFNLMESTFNDLLRGRSLSYPVGLFADQLDLKKDFSNVISLLRRPGTDFLLDAYLAPVFAFQEIDYQPILDNLDAVFPPLVPAFYAACFEFTRRQIAKPGQGRNNTEV